jgi:hypothetical protein
MNEVIKNSQYCKDTIKLKSALESGFISLGERLMRIRDGRMWEGEWDSFAEYLAEIKVTEATASRLISVYGTFVIEDKMDETDLVAIGWSNLYSISLRSKDAEERKSYVDKGLVMPSADLRKELRSSPKIRSCAHSDTYAVRICRDCGESLGRVYEK